MNERDDSLSQSQTEAGKRCGMRVEPSPFNGVKLDLAIITLVLLLLWLILANTVTDVLLQTGILFLCSVVAAAWIIWRVRRILHQHRGDIDGAQ